MVKIIPGTFIMKWGMKLTDADAQHEVGFNAEISVRILLFSNISIVDP